MSNDSLIREIIRLGWRAGPMCILRYDDLFHLVRAVFNGHATLTKDGRATMIKLLAELKRLIGER